MKLVVFALALTPAIGVAAEPLLPAAEGTTWHYNLVQETPSGSLDLTEPNKTEQFAVTYRLGGVQNVDRRALRQLEIYRGEALESVDLIAIEERGIVCPARIDDKGSVIKLIPPQRMLATPLTKGTSWNFEGTIGETEVSQRYQIAGEEDVDVPAGKFRAWRIRCEQTLPAPATIDRWFVPGTGFVKVDTVVKGPSGATLQKSSLKLKEPPKITPGQRRNEILSPEKLSAGVSSEPKGEFGAEFSADTPAIYARWHGHGLPEHVQVRAIFVAENVADVSANYQLDESVTTAPAPNSSGTFTLSKPESGWMPGNYCIEFFVGNQLAQTVKLKIVK